MAKRKPDKQRPKGGPVQEWIRANGSPTHFVDALAASEPRPSEKGERDEKKNYAERLSNAVAVLVANKLRAGKDGKPYFEGVLPEESGHGQESRARTGKGVKKLDVNYSTVELGLGLGVSIKTVNFRDRKTKRFTKNIVRQDNELRAEAMDYHVRQPYAVLVGVVFLPIEACDDGDPKRPDSSWSSFAHAVRIFQHRSGRDEPTQQAELFERIYLGLYEWQGQRRGEVVFVDALDRPVKQFGRPDPGRAFGLDELITRIVARYDGRNKVTPPWEDEPGAKPKSINELEDAGLLGDEPESNDEDD